MTTLWDYMVDSMWAYLPNMDLYCGGARCGEPRGRGSKQPQLPSYDWEEESETDEEEYQAELQAELQALAAREGAGAAGAKEDGAGFEALHLGAMRGASVEGIWGDDSGDEGEAARLEEDAAHMRLAMQRSIEDAKSMEVEEDCFAGGSYGGDSGAGAAESDAAASELMADMGL